MMTPTYSEVSERVKEIMPDPELGIIVHNKVLQEVMAGHLVIVRDNGEDDYEVESIGYHEEA